MRWVLWTALSLALAQAQEQTQASKPDVAILATVHAKELRFEVVPNVTVDFHGSNSENVWKTDREKLPDQVEPHVTYRDIGVRLTITSTLPNIEQILDDALGPQPPERKQED